MKRYKSAAHVVDIDSKIFAEKVLKVLDDMQLNAQEVEVYYETRSVSSGFSALIIGYCIESGTTAQVTHSLVQSAVIPVIEEPTPAIEDPLIEQPIEGEPV